MREVSGPKAAGEPSMTLLENLQRRLDLAKRDKRLICFCSCGCEASPYYETAANWPECHCWCHIKQWEEKVAQCSSE